MFWKENKLRTQNSSFLFILELMIHTYKYINMIVFIYDLIFTKLIQYLVYYF